MAMKTPTKTRSLFCFLFVPLAFMLIPGCVPVFSELQSARTVGQNRIEIAPSFSSVHYSEEGETDGAQNHMGMQVAYGITPNIDVRARYEYLWTINDAFEEGVHIFGIGPKFGIVKDKIAFYAPIGRALGEDYKDSWQLHPTLLLTLPVMRDKIDITLSPKYLLLFCEDCDDLIAINLGLSFSTNLHKWAIRPEYGLLFDPGESGYYGHFSIGLSTTFGL